MTQHAMTVAPPPKKDGPKLQTLVDARYQPETCCCLPFTPSAPGACCQGLREAGKAGLPQLIASEISYGGMNAWAAVVNMGLEAAGADSTTAGIVSIVPSFLWLIGTHTNANALANGVCNYWLAMRDNANRTDLPTESHRQHQQFVQSAAAWVSFTAANTVRGILVRGITGTDPTTIAINLGAKLLSSAAGGYLTGFLANLAKQGEPYNFEDKDPPKSLREAEKKMTANQMKFDDNKRKMGVEYGKAIGGAVGIAASLALQAPDFVSKGIDVDEFASGASQIVSAAVAGGAPTAALLGCWFIGQHLGAYIGNRLAQKAAPLKAADMDFDRLIEDLRDRGSDERDAQLVQVLGPRNADKPQGEFIKEAEALFKSWRAAFADDGSVDQVKCKEFKAKLTQNGVSPAEAEDLAALMFQDIAPDQTERTLLNLASPLVQLSHPMAVLVEEWRAKVFERLNENAPEAQKLKAVAEASQFSRKDLETLTHAMLIYGVVAYKPGSEEHDIASRALAACPKRADLDLDKLANKLDGEKDILPVLKIIKETSDKLKISSPDQAVLTLVRKYLNSLKDAENAGGLKFLNDDFAKAETEAEDLQAPRVKTPVGGDVGALKGARPARAKTANPQAVLALRQPMRRLLGATPLNQALEDRLAVGFLSNIIREPETEPNTRLAAQTVLDGFLASTRADYSDLTRRGTDVNAIRRDVITTYQQIGHIQPLPNFAKAYVTAIVGTQSSESEGLEIPDSSETSGKGKERVNAAPSSTTSSLDKGLDEVADILRFESSESSESTGVETLQAIISRLPPQERFDILFAVAAIRSQSPRLTLEEKTDVGARLRAVTMTTLSTRLAAQYRSGDFASLYRVANTLLQRTAPGRELREFLSLAPEIIVSSEHQVTGSPRPPRSASAPRVLPPLKTARDAMAELMLTYNVQGSDFELDHLALGFVATALLDLEEEVSQYAALKELYDGLLITLPKHAGSQYAALNQAYLNGDREGLMEELSAYRAALDWKDEGSALTLRQTMDFYMTEILKRLDQLPQ